VFAAEEKVRIVFDLDTAFERCGDLEGDQALGIVEPTSIPVHDSSAGRCRRLLQRTLYAKGSACCGWGVIRVSVEQYAGHDGQRPG
jgi:hypothetical protein